jgi:hypothetical protein
VSYCRWSSDDFQSDVYVYEDVSGGFTTHIAGNRVVFAEPLPPEIPYSKENSSVWMKRYAVVSKMLEAAEHVAIDLPHAGETFSDPTPAACADRLEELRALGYVVPQYAIDALREEAKEQAA